MIVVAQIIGKKKSNLQALLKSEIITCLQYQVSGCFLYPFITQPIWQGNPHTLK